MTPSDVEAMFKNLNTRTTRIEQILPTLATKADLTAGLDGLESRLGARIDGVDTRLGSVETRLDNVEIAVDSFKSQMLALHEDLRGDIRMLADHIVSMSQKLDGPQRPS